MMHEGTDGMVIQCSIVSSLGHLLTNTLYINAQDFALPHIALQNSIGHHTFQNRFYNTNDILSIIRESVIRLGALLK